MVSAHPGRSISMVFRGIYWHLLEARGIPVGFTLTAANIDERDAAYDMMESIAGLLPGDKGYIRPEFKNDCQEVSIDLQTPLRKNMKDERPKSFVKLIMRVRRRIKTVIGQLAERFEMEKCRCRDYVAYDITYSQKATGP
ncbi:transposase [Endozoicomonas sp. ONNA2]|uniref:transposase n=1 Tax=Endozoicomonas sp. ONNA2 TaxID=2828741 RepID=UPI0035A192E3